MIPQAAIDLCREFEGLHRLRRDGMVVPYLCPAGVLTIGYGATGPDIVAGLVWTRDQCERRLVGDLAYFTRETLRACPVLASEPPERLGAIVSFAYNLGVGRLRASTLRRRVNERDWPAAAEQLARWTRAGGRVLPGLVRRRAAEARYLLP